jgi:hypothetical protein
MSTMLCDLSRGCNLEVIGLPPGVGYAWDRAILPSAGLPALASEHGEVVRNGGHTDCHM